MQRRQRRTATQLLTTGLAGDAVLGASLLCGCLGCCEALHFLPLSQALPSAEWSLSWSGGSHCQQRRVPGQLACAAEALRRSFGLDETPPGGRASGGSHQARILATACKARRVHSRFSFLPAFIPGSWRAERCRQARVRRRPTWKPCRSMARRIHLLSPAKVAQDAWLRLADGFGPWWSKTALCQLGLGSAESSHCCDKSFRQHCEAKGGATQNLRGRGGSPLFAHP